MKQTLDCVVALQFVLLNIVLLKVALKAIIAAKYNLHCGVQTFDCAAVALKAAPLPHLMSGSALQYFLAHCNPESDVWQLHCNTL